MQNKGKIKGFFLKAKSYKLKANRGFALVELLIAVVLFGIISTFVILAYNRVSGQLFLSPLAYELALSFRQSQSYGVSVHQFQGDFDVGYGLHFDSNSQAKTTYAMFADEDGIEGDGLFNGGFGSSYDASGCLTMAECVSVFKLEKGNTIYKFCGVLQGDGGRDALPADKKEECSVDSLPSSNQNITFLDVTFLRPNPDASIKTNRSAGGVLYQSARVYVASPTGEKRVVEVRSTGQISIK